MRTYILFGLTAGLLLALPSSPTNATQPADETLELKIRALEERAVRAEERLARLEKALAVTPVEAIPFGDIVVNLNEERQQRYLRIKMSFRVSDADHREMSNLVVKKKAALRSWAITFLADQTVRDVSGSKGVQKIQDEMKKGFSAILGKPIQEVLFEEYVVQ